MIRPMLLERMRPTMDPSRVTGGVALEPKLDGHRHLIRVHESGEVEAWSRGGVDSLRKMDEELQIQVAGWEPGVYDGELHCGYGANYEDVARKVNFHHLGYAAFDILEDKHGNNLMGLPWAKRRMVLQEAVGPIQTRASITPILIVNKRDQMRRALARVKARGGEGLVVKLPGGMYEPGARRNYWQKLKRWETDKINLTLYF